MTRAIRRGFELYEYILVFVVLYTPKIFAQIVRSVAREFIPFAVHLSRRGLNPIKLAYNATHIDRMAGPITASAFNRLH